MNLNEYKVLELMLNSEKRFFREISKKSGVSIGGTQQVLKNYSLFIEKQKQGRNTYYSLKNNFETSYLKKIIELKKAQYFFMNNPLLKEFFNYFIKNNTDCLIFGSYANGRFKKNSDIDLLVLSSKKIPEHLSPVKMHLISLSKKQFESGLKNNETLIKEIIKNYIIVNGVDYFTNIFEEKNG